MKKQSLVRSILVVSTIVLSPRLALAAAEGSSGRGGGGQLARVFKEYARQGIQELENDRCIREQVDFTEVRRKIEAPTTLVEPTLDPLSAIDPAVGKRIGVDAVNDYPVSDSIRFNVFSWAAMDDRSRRVLSRHEFLALTGLEGSNDFRISGGKSMVPVDVPNPLLDSAGGELETIEAEFRVGQSGHLVQHNEDLNNDGVFDFNERHLGCESAAIENGQKICRWKFTMPANKIRNALIGIHFNAATGAQPLWDLRYVSPRFGELLATTGRMTFSYEQLGGALGRKTKCPALPSSRSSSDRKWKRSQERSLY